MRALSTFLLIVLPLLAAAQQEPSVAGDVTHPKLAKKKGRYVLFPVIVKSPEYIWGAGGAGSLFFKVGKDSTVRTSSFKGVTFFTLRKQLVFATEGNIYFPDEKYILYILASASHFPDKFWGLGNETPSSAIENYAISQYDIFPRLIRKVVSDFYIGAGYEFQNVFQFDYSQSGESLFDKEDITGRNGGQISGPGIIFTWDNRNHAFTPNKGFYAQFYFGEYNKIFGSKFNFAIKNLDIRKYFAVTKTTVLAFQANLISTTGQVPIRNLANIGSNSYMRGYYEGRYTDKNVIAFQSEFRFPVWGRFGMTTFAGIGKMGRTLADVFVLNKFKPSLGAGIRFALNSREKLNLRLDAGWGKKSQGTYLNMGEAF